MRWLHNYLWWGLEILSVIRFAIRHMPFLKKNILIRQLLAVIYIYVFDQSLHLSVFTSTRLCHQLWYTGHHWLIKIELVVFAFSTPAAIVKCIVVITPWTYHSPTFCYLMASFFTIITPNVITLSSSRIGVATLIAPLSMAIRRSVSSSLTNSTDES